MLGPKTNAEAIDCLLDLIKYMRNAINEIEEHANIDVNVEILDIIHDVNMKTNRELDLLIDFLKNRNSCKNCVWYANEE